MANRVDAAYFPGLRAVFFAAMRPTSSYKDDARPVVGALAPRLAGQGAAGSGETPSGAPPNAKEPGRSHRPGLGIDAPRSAAAFSSVPLRSAVLSG
jgi:hypothetical protein